MFANGGTDEGVVFMLKVIKGGMGIKFGIAVRKPRQQFPNIVLINQAVLKKPENIFSVTNVAKIKHNDTSGGKLMENDGMGDSVKPTPARDPRVEPKTICAKPHLAYLPFASIPKKDVENRGMEMEMEMAVNVIERQAGGAKFFELSRDFRGELITAAAKGKVFEAGRDRVV